MKKIVVKFKITTMLCIVVGSILGVNPLILLYFKQYECQVNTNNHNYLYGLDTL
jgi:hypothetical protein